ncbi:MAG: hypothetical protein ACXWBN_05135 [Acidimicrobiales bacterium]
MTILGVEDQPGQPIRVHVETTGPRPSCRDCGTVAWVKDWQFVMGQSTSRIRTSLERLERFGLVSVEGQTVSVRIALPPLTLRQIDQLPGYLADLCDQRRRSINPLAGSVLTRS